MCFFLVHWQFILLPTKLTGTNIHWSLIIFGGPMKCASFQSSVMEPKAIVFPLKYFQLITFTITEYKQARRKGIRSEERRVGKERGEDEAKKAAERKGKGGDVE